jgi:hypothetical protein
MDIVTGVVAGIGVAAVVQTVLVWRAMRAVGRLAAIETRVEKFGDALTLLTDTTESAFRAVASEMTRKPARSAKAGPAVSAARTRRITRAATRGATVQQIAAAEEVAEGEVLLRMQMAHDRPARPTPTAAAKAARNKKEAAAPSNTSVKREGVRGAVQLG